MKVVGWYTSRFDERGNFLGRCISMNDPESKDQFETVSPLVTLAEAEAAVKQAREDALEEARRACEAIYVDRWSLYKGRAPYTGKEPGRADPDTQGQSDGADACADAIESLKGKT